MAHLGPNRFFQILHFGHFWVSKRWTGTLIFEKNRFLRKFPKLVLDVKFDAPSTLRQVRACLEAGNSSKWSFRKITEISPKSEIEQNRDFATPQFRRQNIERSSKDTRHRFAYKLVRTQNFSSRRHQQFIFWEGLKSRFWPPWTSNFKRRFWSNLAKNGQYGK